MGDAEAVLLLLVLGPKVHWEPPALAAWRGQQQLVHGVRLFLLAEDVSVGPGGFDGCALIVGLFMVGMELAAVWC